MAKKTLPRRGRKRVRNPKVAIKRDTWIPAKIRVTRSGEIEAKVPASAVRRGNPNRWGTSYFVSRSAAVRYYKDYYYPDTKEAVARKLREGEIHIGRPPLKAGQRASIIPGEGRYEITED